LPDAEHREPSRAEGFEPRLEATADEDPREPVPVAASQSVWGVAERESGDLVPQEKATEKTDRETKAKREKMPPVALRNSAPEQPAVAQGARRKPAAALQPVDGSALFL
jgi:hypothetical protein